jgi:CHAT domain-containing protein
MIRAVLGCAFLVVTTFVVEGAPAESMAGGTTDATDAVRVRDLLERVETEIIGGAWEEALDHAVEAAGIAGRTGDPLLEAESLQALGNAWFLFDRYDESLTAFRRALAMAEGMGDNDLEAELLKDVGVTEKQVGEYGRALFHLQLATERRADDRETILDVSILGNLGSLYQQLGAHQLAMTTFDEELLVARRIGNLGGEIDCLARISDLYLHLGHPERALESIESALNLELVGGIESHPMLKLWLLDMAIEAYSLTGRRDLASSSLTEALAMWRAAGNRIEEAQLLAYQGWLVIDDDLGEAEALFSRALAVARGLEPVAAVWAYAGLAETALRTGELDEAIELLGGAVDHLEHRRRGMVSAHQRVLFADSNIRINHRLIGALLDRGERRGNDDDPVRAFHVLERARARVLAEALVENRLEPPRWMSSELAQRELSTHHHLRELVELLADPDLEEQRRSELLLELEKAELEADAVVEALRREDPRYALLRYPEPLDLGGARALLDHRTALLSYLVTRDRVAVFVVTKSGLVVERLPTTPEAMAARVSNARDLLLEPLEAGWLPVGRRLAGELIEPVLRVLPSEINALIIIPDGPLHSLPFEALPNTLDPALADGGRRVLLDDYEISYVASVTVLAELRRRGGRRADDRPVDALVFADPRVELGDDHESELETMAGRFWRLYQQDGFVLGPLPFGASEAELVGDYGGKGSGVYVEGAATEARFKSEDLGRFDIIHFATHGLVTPAAPARSALVLRPGEEGEDGFLQAREIARTRLDARLVVLSACRTALGRPTPSEGVQSLARAFLGAGASTVVCSLWDVDDAETTRLMEVFYGKLGEGMPTAAALRQAKLTLLRSGRRVAPATWASFILIGDGGVVVPRDPTTQTGSRWWWIPAALLIVVALVASRVRTRSDRGRRIHS